MFFVTDRVVPDPDPGLHVAREVASGRFQGHLDRLDEGHGAPVDEDPFQELPQDGNKLL